MTEIIQFIGITLVISLFHLLDRKRMDKKFERQNQRLGCAKKREVKIIKLLEELKRNQKDQIIWQ